MPTSVLECELSSGARPMMNRLFCPTVFGLVAGVINHIEVGGFLGASGEVQGWFMIGK